jgi:hypothetical protein
MMTLFNKETASAHIVILNAVKNPCLWFLKPTMLTMFNKEKARPIIVMPGWPRNPSLLAVKPPRQRPRRCHPSAGGE